MNRGMVSLWSRLSDFVKIICADRDPSHGHKHMEKVAYNALKIYLQESLNFTGKNDTIYILNNIVIVAWLHDVADHKYDKDGTLKLQVEQFILTFTQNTETTELLMKIIELISYSKENNAIIKNKPIDYVKELGEDGCIIRHIVSDADKLEALGKIGFERMIEYSKHNYREKNNREISQSEINKILIDHSNDKLLRLKDQFIRTETGKLMAESLHKELVDELNQL